MKGKRIDWGVAGTTGIFFALGIWLLSHDPNWGEKIFGRGLGLLWVFPGMALAAIWPSFTREVERRGGFVNFARPEKEGWVAMFFKAKVEELGYRLPLLYAANVFFYPVLILLGVIFAYAHRPRLGEEWGRVRFINLILLGVFYSFLAVHGGLITAVSCHVVYNTFADL